MPITKSAKKALRQDRKRTITNQIIRTKLKTALVKSSSEPTTATLSEAYSNLDTAVKKNIIHKNKAARVKSQLAAKLKQSKPEEKASPTNKKSVTKKTSKKKTTKKPKKEPAKK